MIDTIHIAVCMKPIEGNFASNAVEHGVAGLNVDGSRITTTENLAGGAYAENPTHRAAKDMWTRDRKGDTNCFKRGGAGEFEQPPGRWPSNVVLDGSDEVVEQFPETGKSSGGCGAASKKTALGGHVYGDYSGETLGRNAGGVGDEGSAARYFKQCEADD
jgi:hypothetical protein